MEIVAYPALQDLGKGIAIRLCENESIQAEVNRSGLRRLIMLNIESTARYVKDRLSNTARLAFCGANICSAAELVDDCIACAVDSLAADSGMPILAECGGFQYLQEELVDKEGTAHRMCGVGAEAVQGRAAA